MRISSGLYLAYNQHGHYTHKKCGAYFKIIERIAHWQAIQVFRLNQHIHDSEYKLPAYPTEQIDVSYTRLAQLQYGQRHQARRLCIPHPSTNAAPSIRQIVCQWRFDFV